MSIIILLGRKKIYSVLKQIEEIQILVQIEALLTRNM